MSARKRIEAGFGAWGRLVVRWRWLAIAACLGLTAALVARLPELRVDNSDEAFLLADDPERIRYDRFKEQFGREDRVLVLLRPPEVFDLGFLEHLRSLHREIEREVPYVEEVTSLVNARNTRGDGDELIVEDLMEDWPESEADLRALRARVLANPLYVDALITADTRYTLISIKPFTWSTLGPRGDDLGGFEETGASEANREAPLTLTDVEGYELVDALMAVLARYESADIEVHLVGGPSIDHRITQAMQRDVTVLLTLSLLVEAVLLYLIFRRIMAVVLPMLVVVLAMLSTMGLMVWLDIPFSLTLNMLPAFLLVVGVCDSIHILAIAYRRLAAGDTREEAIVAALTHSGLAVVMTSVTTAAALVSFVFAELAAIVQLGVLAPAGVMLAMLYSLVLLPALLAVTPRASAAARTSLSLSEATDRLLARVGDAVTRHPWRTVAATGALLLAALPGFLRVGFSHDGIRWLPEGDPMRVAFETLDREFGGTSSLEILVHTDRENGLYEPELLARIERAMRHGETLKVGDRRASKAISIVDLLKETHQALNENRPGYYSLPETRQLVAQELLLFEGSGSDDLEELTDTQLRTARVSLRTPWVDTLEYPPFVAVARADLREILGDDVRVELTGGPSSSRRSSRG